MRPAAFAILAVAAMAALVGGTSAPAATAVVAHSASSCTVLKPPSSLGKILLSLHRAYMRHQPGVRNPKITGPVGRIYLGSCGGERYALASFDARYSGLHWGIQDQPERFTKAPGKGWRDIGNTGGPPCGSAPTALLKAWKIVRSCPG